MIDIEAYFGRWMDGAPEDHVTNAMQLLERVIKLQAYMIGKGVIFRHNPKTGTPISGELYGGYRPQNCGIGASQSAHKLGMAVDLYDPLGEIDLHLYNNQRLLEEYDLYMEHPDATQGWCHLSIKPPASDRRIFYP